MSADLDPSAWPDFRSQAHRMLDDILDSIQNIREEPVWRPIPDDLRTRLRTADVPLTPSDLSQVHEEFMRDILPYAAGNSHPGFMGWVHGGGTPVGLVAEMLAAGLNANLGGRDHAPIEIERQIVRWMREVFQFPDSATGLFVTGTSMANLIGVLVARDSELGFDVRREGLKGNEKRLTAYTSTAAHASIGKAMDIAGLGSSALRHIRVDARHRIDADALAASIAADRR
ncbi:MAG TPA: pyridoxal-dependent decarboxylase, partial [Bryobacteraceae bacterium]